MAKKKKHAKKKGEKRIPPSEEDRKAPPESTSSSNTAVQQLSNDCEQDHKSESGGETEKEGRVWRRRSSVKECVEEIENLVLEGEVLHLPGMKALPGISTQEVPTTDNISIDDSNGVGITASDERIKSESELDDTNSNSDETEKEGRVWRRRSSVKECVEEIENMVLEGEVLHLPGMKALPGISTQEVPTTDNISIDDSNGVGITASDERIKSESELDDTNSNSDETEKEGRVWRRRSSVKECVEEIENLVLEGEVLHLPGMKALPGISKQKIVASENSGHSTGSEEDCTFRMATINADDIDFLAQSSSGEIIPDVTNIRGDESFSDTSLSSTERFTIANKITCVLENKIDNWKPFDIMDASPTSPVDGHPRPVSLLIPDGDSGLGDSPLLKSLNQIIRVLYEFLETEIKFSIDVNSLKTVMSEIKYSTLNSARKFVSSVPYVGILVSTESIKITSNLLVKHFQESERIPPLDSKGNVIAYTNVSDCFDCCSANFMAVANGLERCAPFFPLFASFIINHDDLSLLYRDMTAADEEFLQYMSSVEILVGEGLLSLLIKPVQRLPRYVLLCREIHSSIAKALSILEEGDMYYHALSEQLEFSKKVLENMSAFTTKCNEAVRIHQDNLRMHSLQMAFEESGSDDLIEGFVSNKRRIIREGQLMRHHKHVGMKYHEFQIFSDVMLSSAAVGTSLKLEHVIVLTKDSDTLCLPIPTMFDSDKSTWMYVCSKKMLYCSAETVEKRDLWVKDLTKCLISNKADSDVYLMKKQIALVNTMISQINLLWKEANEKALDDNDGDEKRGRDSSLDPVHMQVSWWRILGILKRFESGNNSASESLQRVIDMHSMEVTNRILQSVSLVDSDDNIISSSFKTKNSLITLLRDGHAHYLVSSGYFFESSSYSVGYSLGDGVRPYIMRVFLFSDLLLATYFDNVAAPLRYAFHIRMSDLQCGDIRADVGPTAIQLVDTSVAVSSRRFSLFGKSSSEQKKRERIIFAPSLEEKFDWLSLILQTAETCRDVPPGSQLEGPKFDSLKIASIPLPLHRVGTLSSTSPWQFESNISQSRIT